MSNKDKSKAPVVLQRGQPLPVTHERNNNERNMSSNGKCVLFVLLAFNNSV